jgi:hypothetical protein
MKERARKQRDAVAAKLALLSNAATDQLAELSQHQVCTSCGCGAEEPESVALKAAIDAKPADCLAEVKADSVEQFAKGCLSEISACTTYQHVIDMLSKGIRQEVE